MTRTDNPREVGASLATIATPALLVDRRVLVENIVAMAARARDGGVELWPHAKTHKSFEIAALQRRHGAAGLTVATIREAEMFAAAGFTDLLLASPPVGEWRLDRTTQLATRAQLRVVVDSAAVVDGLQDACARACVEIPYLWEVDCGTRRFGTPPGGVTADAIARAVERAPHCRFDGLLAFGGHAYAARTDDEVLTAARQEREAITETVAAVAARGLNARTGSIGTTPTAHLIEPAPAVTELRPGNYVFYDATQIDLGVVSEERCALTILATVLSRPHPDCAILDAGSKALAADRMTPRTRDFGFIQHRSDIRLERLFEEHGIASVPPSRQLAIGDRVRVVPNHACASVNLHSEMFVVEDDEIVDVWPVDVRGWTEQSPVDREATS